MHKFRALNEQNETPQQAPGLEFYSLRKICILGQKVRPRLQEVKAMKKILNLFCMLFIASQAVCSNLTWSAPVTISGAGASDPQIVMDSNGNVTSAWIEGGVVKASTLPSGGSWGAAATVSSSGASTPRIGLDSSGNVIAIWLESGRVKSSVLTFGGNWGGVTILSDLGASTPELAVDSNGNAIAVWENGGIIQTSTLLAGGSWDPASSFSTLTNSDHPQVAIGDGTAMLVWHNVSSGQDQIITSSATVGGSWGTPQNLVTTSLVDHNHNYPHLAVDNQGNAFAVWYQSDFGGSSNSDYINVTVLGAMLKTGDSFWSDPFAISRVQMGDPANLRAKAGFDLYGNALAVWGLSTEGSTYNIEAGSKLKGIAYPGFVQLTALNLYAYQGDLAVNSLGSALVCYMDWDGTDVRIRATETTLGAFQRNRFTVPQTISEGANNGYPRVATVMIGSTVNTAAVWMSSDGVNNTISAATGSKLTIAPPTNLSVTQNVNSFGVFDEYYNTVTWTASTDSNVAGYVIYRDNILLSAVNGSTFEFVDHNQAQNGSVTYGIATFEPDFQQSAIANVAFP